MARGAAAVRFVTLYRKEPIKSMNCTVNIAQDTYWVGASDRRLARFENLFPLTRGVAYNSYLILDEKTVLLDTADYAVGRRYQSISWRSFSLKEGAAAARNTPPSWSDFSYRST